MAQDNRRLRRTTEYTNLLDPQIGYNRDRDHDEERYRNGPRKENTDGRNKPAKACACPRGQSPQEGLQDGKTLVDLSDQSDTSPSPRSRPQQLSYREASFRRKRRRNRGHKSSDGFYSFKDSRPSSDQSTATFKSWDGGHSERSRERQRAGASKSAESPLVTVTKTSTKTKSGRSRSRSVTVKFRPEPPPPAEACCVPERPKPRAHPCCRPAGYQPSYCDSGSSTVTSRKSASSKCKKRTVLYCPEPLAGSGEEVRSDCWNDLPQRCLEDRAWEPRESYLDVTIISGMEDPENPNGGRARRTSQGSADHHERAVKNLDHLRLRQNPMDEAPAHHTHVGGLDRELNFGQKVERTNEENEAMYRNRYRRESLNPQTVPEPEPNYPVPSRDPDVGPTEEGPYVPEEPDYVEPPRPARGPKLPPLPTQKAVDYERVQPAVDYERLPSQAQQPAQSARQQSFQQPAQSARQQSFQQPAQSARRQSFQQEPLIGARESVSDYNIKLTQKQSDGSSNSSFPFQETPSGNLRIDKRNVSFQNPKIAVLVAKPERTRVNIQQGHRHTHPNDPPPPPSPPVTEECDTCGVKEKCDWTKFRIPEERGYDTEPTYCHPSSCRAKTKTREKSYEEQRRESLMENTKGSKDFLDNVHHRFKTANNPDTKIRIGRKEFPCHAIALQCYSKYFDKYRRPKEKIMEVEIPEHIIAAHHFPSLMDWILIDDKEKLLVLDKENAVDLFSAAVYLGMSELKQDVLDYVKIKLESGDPSIVKLYELANTKENCKELVSLLATKLSSLFPKIVKTRQFLLMDVKELILLLSADNVAIKSELDICEAAARWLLYDWDRRRELTVPVMKTVRFGLLSPIQLSQAGTLPDYAKIISHPTVKKMLDDGLAFAIFREHYKGRPGELNRWINQAGVQAPRPRHNMDAEQDSSRVPARVSFDSTEDDNDAENRPPPQSRSRSSIPLGSPKGSRRHRKSISEEVTERSTKELGDSNVGVSRFSRAHSHDFQEEDSMTSFGKKPAASWRDAKKRNSNSDKGKEEDVGEWMEVEWDKDQVGAAVLIQSHVRGFLARKSYEKLRRAVRTIQAAYRAHRARTHGAKKYSPLQSRKTRLTGTKHPARNTFPRVGKLTLDDSDAVIVFGGFDPKFETGPENDAREIYQLDPLTNQWTLMGLLPEPRVYAGAVYMAGVIIIFGGADPRYRTSRDKPVPSATTWSLQVETGKWRQLADMIYPKSNFGYATMNGKIFVFGGVDMDANGLDSCESYDPQYNSWTSICPMDGPRLSMAVSKAGDKIWIAGGVSKNIRLPLLKSVIVYDVKKNSFFAAPALPKPRGWLTMTSYYDRVFVFAGAGKMRKGERTKSLTDVTVYENGEWRKFGNLVSARHAHSQVKLGKYVLLIGGVSSETQLPLDTIESFNLEKGSSSTKVAPMPKRLSGHCSIVLH